jgi:lysozyme
MIPGIDVSHWQREIDWSEVKRSGVKFAFIKATEFPDKKTSLYIDDEMRKNIIGASSNGIFWSAYHFFRTHIDPIIQAKVFCETVGEFSSLPPVLDLEVAGSKGERLNYKVQQFLDETEKLTNKRPIVYSSGGFWRSYMTCKKRSHADWASAYPLWVAQYTNLWPTPLYPWAGWEFWQFTDKGKIPGVITHVDLNWFNGSEEDLKSRFNIGNISESGLEPFLTLNENSEAKYTSNEQAIDNIKSDFQEPILQIPSNKQHMYSSQNSRLKSIHELKSDAKEEDWIRTYFLQKTALEN